MLDTLPYNQQAEQSVLGAVFFKREVIQTLIGILTPGDFYLPQHNKIFAAMVDMQEAGEPIDIVTLTETLMNIKQLDDIGGAQYLTQLASAVPTAENAVHYAKIVKENALKRKLILLGHKLATQGGNAEDPSVLMAEVMQQLIELETSKADQSGFQSAKAVLEETYERIEMVTQNKGAVTGVPTGYPDLDKMTAGLQRSDLIIVAARPSVGKTAFALNVGQNVAIRANETVAIFSLEMPAAQLMTRMLCAEGNIDASRIRTGLLDEDDWQKITMSMGILAKAPIFIDDTSGITVADIRTKCRALKKKHGLGLILIDYLQLIQGRGKSREEEVSAISRTLKSIARELNVPIIALSQLSRGVEKRQDKRPGLSDLRESGSIEQDADIVAFLYRDDYYNRETDNKNVVELIIGKQRNGPTGTVELAFAKEFNKFLPLNNRFRQTTIDEVANGKAENW
ncbi:replicative DNA helicase [Brevibacillus centrosporus]|uniref:replicative DNA helicase n=1 Tax=Brevibacillus centrosporus TaxID=54910 RepID=UPI002E205A96|nr:replicative DNA helicase [Brevibacillus centrosporus]MED1954633.1 replicative DNA helicase [Brevibacillus centrosporus]